MSSQYRISLLSFATAAGIVAAYCTPNLFSPKYQDSPTPIESRVTESSRIPSLEIFEQDALDSQPSEEKQLETSVDLEDLTKRVIDFEDIPLARDFNKEKYRDPSNSGNSLLDITELQDRYVSEHFKLGEYARTGGQIQDYIRLNPKLVKAVEEIREKVGQPVNINSGYRSYERQIALIEQGLTKAKKSKHMSGNAVDIAVPGMSGAELAEIVREMFPNAGIGIGKTFIHLDIRKKPATWKY